MSVTDGRNVVKTGQIKSQTVLEGYDFSSSARPAIKDGIAYIATANKGMVAFDINSKIILWNTNTRPAIIFTAPYVGKGAETVESSPILVDDRLIFAASDGYVYTLDAKNGKILNEIELKAPVFSAVAKYEDSLLVADFSAYLSRFALDK